MTNIDCKDPLKIDEKIKLEEESADLEEDPLKLEQSLSTTIKTEPTFDSNDHELRKRRSRNSKNKLKCDECMAKFQYLCLLNAHSYKTHKKAKVDYHKCDFCDHKLRNLKDVLIHIMKVHKGKNVPQCDICNKCFECKSLLEEHIEVIHKGKIPNCEICVKEFSSKKTLEEHEKAYHNEHTFISKCDFCSKIYKGPKSKYILENHIKSIHEKVRHKCKDCGKSFSQQCALKIHFSVVHKGLKLYKCELCNEQFGYQHVLKKHYERTHGELELNCSICNTTFTSSMS